MTRLMRFSRTIWTLIAVAVSVVSCNSGESATLRSELETLQTQLARPTATPSSTALDATALNQCLTEDEIDALMVALLASLDANRGLAELTGWFAAVPGSAPALSGALEESHGAMEDDFALFRRAPVQVSPRLEPFWEALERAVNQTDFGVYQLRESVPWYVGDEPPDPNTLWSGADLWGLAAAELAAACIPD